MSWGWQFLGKISKLISTSYDFVNEYIAKLLKNSMCVIQIQYANTHCVMSITTCNNNQWPKKTRKCGDKPSFIEY